MTALRHMKCKLNDIDDHRRARIILNMQYIRWLVACRIDRDTATRMAEKAVQTLYPVDLIREANECQERARQQ